MDPYPVILQRVAGKRESAADVSRVVCMEEFHPLPPKGAGVQPKPAWLPACKHVYICVAWNPLPCEATGEGAIDTGSTVVPPAAVVICGFEIWIAAPCSLFLSAQLCITEDTEFRSALWVLYLELIYQPHVSSVSLVDCVSQPATRYSHQSRSSVAYMHTHPPPLLPNVLACFKRNQ